MKHCILFTKQLCFKQSGEHRGLTFLFISIQCSYDDSFSTWTCDQKIIQLLISLIQRKYWLPVPMLCYEVRRLVKLRICSFTSNQKDVVRASCFFYSYMNKSNPLLGESSTVKWSVVSVLKLSEKNSNKPFMRKCETSVLNRKRSEPLVIAGLLSDLDAF